VINNSATRAAASTMALTRALTRAPDSRRTAHSDVCYGRDAAPLSASRGGGLEVAR
jgi:hypothetical protein